MANDFSSDPDVMALWRLESGNMLADSIRTHTIVPTGTFVADLADFKEGVSSGVFNDNIWGRIDQNDLEIGFPYKYGQPLTDMSFSFYFLATASNNDAIIGNSVVFHQNFVIRKAGLDLTFDMGVNNNQSSQGGNALRVVLGRWYHAVITYKTASNTWTSWVKDLTTQVDIIRGAIFAKTPSNPDDQDICFANSGVSNTNRWAGKLDEIVVFKRALTEPEVYAIREGVFPTVPAETISCDDTWAVWNMDQAPPGPLTDSSGNGNNLTLSDGDQAAGIIANSIAGLSASLEEDPGTLDISSNAPFTISLWWYPAKNTEIDDNDDSTFSVNYYRDGGPAASLTFALSVDTTNLTMTGGIVVGGVLGIDAQLGTVPVPAGFVDSWHNIVARYDGVQLLLYIDNSVVAYEEGPTDVDPPGTVVVSISATSAHPVSGSSRLDDVVIWMRSLTGSELNYIWNEGLANPVACEPAYTTDSEIEIVVHPFTTNTLLGTPESECVVIPRGCKPLAAMELDDAPLVLFSQDDTPTAAMELGDAPEADLDCEII